MTDEHDPRGGGLQICGPDVEGCGAVSQTGRISKRRPPLEGSDNEASAVAGAAPHASGVPSDLEAVLDWARRAAEDRTEVPALLDELDPLEHRALTARLVQLVSLLELRPAGIDAAYFVARFSSLSGDFAQDPWSTTEANR
jgi:hypothetical protein